MKADDLVKIEQLVEDTASKLESVLHKAMKKWVAFENYESGVPIDAFEFEKRIKYEDEIGRLYKHTIVDVFVNHDGGKAYYC